MKQKLIILIIITVILCASGCKKGDSGSSIEGVNFDKDASYALGMNIGMGLAADGIIPDMDEFYQGMKDVLSGGEARLTEDEAIAKLQAAFQEMMQKMEADSMEKESEAIIKNTEYLAENSKKPGIVITSSGLQYEVISESGKRKPSVNNVVKVHYEGRLIDGTIFDSSYTRGVPAEFPLNEVIQGWTEGLQLMGEGSKYRLYIPSELGYGSRNAGTIPPYSTLIFEVELLEIIER
ncbi:MAG: FKBP-type peptidyl-prolyl cis-trans isomerase [Treponema sp.]|jgi:FKBP-type peptidyl-prolyl cis-trans isomerase|nr:FKBP-type peptidyl-prolyl cis-trans isomerase [Treponema sp.]